jgi:hypothetical protein
MNDNLQWDVIGEPILFLQVGKSRWILQTNSRLVH